MANGCQNNRPHPAAKNIYPVPSFNVLTSNPVSFDKGVRTEYTTEAEIPANRVYLIEEPRDIRSKKSINMEWNFFQQFMQRDHRTAIYGLFDFGKSLVGRVGNETNRALTDWQLGGEGGGGGVAGWELTRLRRRSTATFAWDSSSTGHQGLATGWE